MHSRDDDHAAIDALVGRFFALFDNRGGRPVDLTSLRAMTIGEAVVIKAVGDTLEIGGVDAFIAPRQLLLNGGGLTDFSESELEAKTDVFGNIAQRLSTYRKGGVSKGERFEARGMKTFQFVRTADGWRISAVAWDDE